MEAWRNCCVICCVYSLSLVNSGHSTLPAIYIKSMLVGGCDTVKSLHSKGDLLPMVREFGTSGTCAGLILLLVFISF